MSPARRCLPLLGIPLASVAAMGQAPDVVVKLDVRLVYTSVNGGNGEIRWYDRLGRYSTVGLAFRLEPGLRVVITEKLQRVAGASDDEPLDEYYVQNGTSWRVGRQYVPFGRETLYRESLRAIRFDTVFAVGDFPFMVAACDNGPRRTRGALARVQAGPLGLSVAGGDHFAIAPTALTLLRRPEDAPGPGGGYRTLYGVDLAFPRRDWTLYGEAIRFRDGHTASDVDRDAFDVGLRWDHGTEHYAILGWTQDTSGSSGTLRLQGSSPVTRHVWIEPMIRFRNGSFHDLCVALRVKL
ncbi:MAG: hypothetical protein KIS66_10385 [Fimbriimonadaceae bacterium]|nr:hypothetical protein [Fimbriimonadaceae bacterium]